MSDIEIIPRSKYLKKLKIAEQLITHKKDIPILAAVLAASPDYFLSGDSHFFTDKIRAAITVKTAKEFLSEK